jgi:mRNA-degrading endonuclease RelE of RelBE toxin-antitoxin system
VKIEWSPAARAAFHRGDYHRLRVGPYRVVYMTEDDLVTIERVDSVA